MMKYCSPSTCSSTTNTTDHQEEEDPHFVGSRSTSSSDHDHEDNDDDGGGGGGTRSPTLYHSTTRARTFPLFFMPTTRARGNWIQQDVTSSSRCNTSKNFPVAPGVVAQELQRHDDVRRLLDINHIIQTVLEIIDVEDHDDETPVIQDNDDEHEHEHSDEGHHHKDA